MPCVSLGGISLLGYSRVTVVALRDIFIVSGYFTDSIIGLCFELFELYNLVINFEISLRYDIDFLCFDYVYTGYIDATKGHYTLHGHFFVKKICLKDCCGYNFLSTGVCNKSYRVGFARISFAHVKDISALPPRNVLRKDTRRDFLLILG